MRQATIDSIALGAYRDVERIIAERPGDGPAEREIPIRIALATWIAHAVNRETRNDRRRVGRTRP
ncbi:hypothetical protein AFCDBAGC_3359 [Methylobacterium cerastii]|uniref:Uncharacterized protein n=1 Tax=Methylobacterium cerastii TaxID=932741 RepID=A0ABQ4QL61_9HYPH|nr:hypothetical protein [Methylobacterium cerastii]GJD45486.1 hypothetical protein AFCDBAGC_3359 [Methylobacterium cerastii]